MPQPAPTRRRFLRASGVALALPLLESAPLRGAGKPAAAPPRRLVCVGNEFGMYPGAFWPEQEKDDFELPPLLQPLSDLRDRFTLFGHLDHGLKGGHFAVHTFLTGVKSADARGLPEGGISLDQRAAEFVGAQTRFPSLTIGSEDGLHGGPMMSWTRTGTRIPPIPGPRELFRKLFLDDGPDARQQTVARLARHQSILDAVLGDARALKKRVSQADRLKLDEYFASVREVELKLDLENQWQKIPKPPAPLDEPENEGLTKDLPKIFDLMALALQTDSTRVATLEIGGSFAASDLGIRQGYHSLSHHGQVQESIEQLVQIELYQMEQFARFLQKLTAIHEPNAEGSLLDNTMVLFGSGMGNANSHTNQDLPIILAGGGFRHGQHLWYPAESNKRVPLCNLYLSLLQRFGVEADSFSMSSSTLSGLELA